MDKAILTEKRNPRTTDIDLMSGYEIAEAINNEDKKVAFAVEKVLPQIGEAIELIASAFRKGGRLAYFGAGTSGRIGVLDASECPPTFGVPAEMVCAFIAGGEKALRFAVENAEDSVDAGLNDLQKFAPGENDVVVGVSASGNARYVCSVLKNAKISGVRTIGVSSNPEAALRRFSDVFINPETGEEVIAGSSRMKSGTAQKMILNMLTTGAMIRIGKTYENYMIDVQMSNEKLSERGIRIVSEIAGVAENEAAKYIEQSGRNVKTACVMALKNVSKDEAERQLSAAGGFLRKIIR